MKNENTSDNRLSPIWWKLFLENVRSFFQIKFFTDDFELIFL